MRDALLLVSILCQSIPEASENIKVHKGNHYWCLKHERVCDLWPPSSYSAFYLITIMFLYEQGQFRNICLQESPAILVEFHKLVND